MELRREGLQLTLQIANTILLLGILIALRAGFGQPKTWTGAEGAHWMERRHAGPPSQAEVDAVRTEFYYHSLLVSDPQADYQPYGTAVRGMFSGIQLHRALSVYVQNESPIPVCIAQRPPVLPGMEPLPWKC